ncbi:class I SAM-dependent methyltransferase [Sphingobium bisphenolivorans]|uniref:class I SAM-dependent methyltransferase n=1 Tax=Sphingobium bisphenolivorans TaxID=1335760 RepID=UPI0003A6F1E2|nr:class I SAM-dependent methyltransferase [Sphingobium bisphenolivorans]
MTGPLPPDLETGSARYARRFAGPAGSYLLSVQDRALGDLVRAAPDGLATAVDVGGGHGQLVGRLLDLGFETTVLGSRADCAEQLMGGPHAGRISYRVGSLLDLPFADRSFDLVTSIRLLAHIEDADRLIDELCRVAGHSVIVDYPTLVGANALASAAFPIKRLIEKDTRTYQSFWPTTVRRAFARNGFHPVRSVKQFTAPMGLHRMGGRPVQLMEEGLRRIGVTRLVGNPVLQRFDRRAA